MKRCAFTFCQRPQGGGTWMDVHVEGRRTALPVCEIHWQALRAIPPPTREEIEA